MPRSGCFSLAWSESQLKKKKKKKIKLQDSLIVIISGGHSINALHFFAER